MNMVITNLKGGLGNQMFEYAMGLTLSIEKKTEYKLDTSHFDEYFKFSNETRRFLELDSFNTTLDIASKQEIKQVKYPYSLLSTILNLANLYLLAHGYIKYPILIKKNSKDIYLDGYFQNEIYFKKHSDRVIKDFTLKKSLETKDYKSIKEDILNSKNPSVSIHIRRGDYITNTNANKHHGVLDDSYYISAIETLKKKYGTIKEFIFSDDVDWVKKNLQFIDNEAIYVSKLGLNSAQEMILMSKCKNNIIANSSFSWWGAWLNRNKEKTVIAPKSWLRNGDGIHNGIVPKEWIRM